MKDYKEYSQYYAPNIKFKTKVDHSVLIGFEISKNDSKKYDKWSDRIFDFIRSIIFSIRDNFFRFFYNPKNTSKKYGKKGNYIE